MIQLIVRKSTVLCLGAEETTLSRAHLKQRRLSSTSGGIKSPVAHLPVNGSPIEIIDSFKILGTTISSGLDWAANINSILKKARQRMYFLRQLKKLGLRHEILLQFYRAVIESVLCFSLSVWFSNTTKDQRRRLSRVVKKAGRIIGCELPSLEMYLKRSVAKSKRTIADHFHPAHGLFQLLPFGRR